MDASVKLFDDIFNPGAKAAPYASRIRLLRRKFSVAGYAVWLVVFNNLLECAAGQSLRFDEHQRRMFAMDLDMTLRRFDMIVAFCCELGMFKLSDDGATVTLCTVSTPVGAPVASEKTAAPPRQQKGVSPGGGRVLSAPVPCSEIVDLWNETCKALPPVQRLGAARSHKLISRMLEWGDTPEAIRAKAREIFTAVASSAFLCGDNQKSWRASFDWIVDNPLNWVKVIEGNYRTKTEIMKQRIPEGVKLGYDEWIEPDGRRTYGTGRITIPLNAPPRPSSKCYWNIRDNAWCP